MTSQQLPRLLHTTSLKMESATAPQQPGAHCAFVDNLPPEIRVRIYEYALACDIPLHHAAGLRPFIEKLTGQKSGLSANENTSTAAPTQPLSPVNTCLLVANKLIYKEAVEVFYNVNTIRFDMDLCKLTEIV